MTPERIGGYEIISELGRGAMGVVYRAHDPSIGRQLAIKVIRIDAGTSMAEGTQLRQRLIREASTAGKLSHPGIVTVYQLGEDGDSVFIAMEFVEGVSLERSLMNNPSPDRAWILDILSQLAVALDYAHKGGVVHRDIKPANVLVREDGRAKIADFGIAKMTAATGPGLTSVGASIGSPAYMSPEQIKATQIDGRSDQFALATMAFQMLTGRMPFKGDTAHTVMYQIVMADPFTAMEGDIPLTQPVRNVLAKALSKNPSDRYPECAMFIGQLAAVVNASQAAATVTLPQHPPPSIPVRSGQGYAPPALSSGSNPAPTYQPPPVHVTHVPVQRKTSIALPIIAGFLFVILAAGGGYWYYQTCCAPPPTPIPAPNEPGVKESPVKQATHRANKTTAPATQPSEAPSAPPVTAPSAPPQETPASKSPETPSAPPPEKSAAPEPETKNAAPTLAGAARNGRPGIVKNLISKGANVNETHPNGTTILMIAAEADVPDNSPVVDMLLSAGARVNAVDNRGRAALHRAIAHNKLDTARALISRGADVNLADAEKSTPLMLAADSASGDMVKLLLSRGAKRGMKDAKGRIAMQRAAAANNIAALQALRAGR
jgi:serine/threonine-protein kinase